MEVMNVRHQWSEKSGFKIDRQTGTNDYVFLHFNNPVELLNHGKKITTAPGAFIIYSPKTPQWFCSYQPLVHDWAHVTGSVTENLADFGLEVNTLYYPSNHFALTRLFEEIEMEFLSHRQFTEKFIEIKLFEMFIRLSRDVFYENQNVFISGEVYKVFKKLRTEVFSHLEQRWTTGEMASFVHLSESRFYVIYRQIFGITPNNDLILTRIEKAKRMLMLNKYTNMQIAELAGYNNEYHFIRQFKKHTGISPQKYAKEFGYDID